MISFLQSKTAKMWGLGFLGVIGLLGIFMRFYQITANNFFLYDEGYYLNFNRKVLEVIANEFPKNSYNLMQSIIVLLRVSLATGKLVWFTIVDARVFWGGLEEWYFPRIVSAVFGTSTLVMAYVFAKAFFNSRWLGIFSAALLAILPSHVFYSRLALQESMCAFFFLAGFYFYLFPGRLQWKTFLSSFLLSLAYFANYRLIILPVFVLFCEVFLSYALKQKPDCRKYFWHSLIFTLFVFGIGGLDRGQNTIVTFAWMFHQAPMAEAKFNLLNFFAYPYYIFKLEGAVFALLFLGNIYFLLRREWKKFFPFAFGCFYMGVFSFAAEKGARYICVLLPFMAMAVAALITSLYNERKSIAGRGIIGACGILLSATLIIQSIGVMKFHSDYETSIAFIKKIDPHAKVASTQSWIQSLFMDKNNVAEAPHGYKVLFDLYNKGYRYLIVCPQAYVSYTTSKEKFDAHLHPYLAFIMTNLRPIKAFRHFSRPLLERFVFEHTENLERSIAFVNSRNTHLGELRIYDIKTFVDLINQRLSAYNASQTRKAE